MKNFFLSNNHDRYFFSKEQVEVRSTFGPMISGRPLLHG